MRWESPSYAASADRYDLTVGDSTDQITVDVGEAGRDHARDGGDAPQGQVPTWFLTQSPEEYPNLAALADQFVRT